jgi:uncharacterized coiled-coil DUF342 family protein
VGIGVASTMGVAISNTYQQSTQIHKPPEEIHDYQQIIDKIDENKRFMKFEIDKLEKENQQLFGILGKTKNQVDDINKKVNDINESLGKLSSESSSQRERIGSIGNNLSKTIKSINDMLSRCKSEDDKNECIQFELY